MPTTWFISDTHWGHEATCTKFKRPDGVTPLRPFSCAEEMDEEMVKRWNDRVGDNDKVYHLGDVTIKSKFLPILNRLKGKKKLIMGNHDIFDAKEYLKYFYDVCAFRKLSGLVLTHIPLHPNSLREHFGVNVHGHYHANDMADPRYLNVCVEHTDYAPITLEEVRDRIAKKQEQYDLLLERSMMV